MDIKNKTSVYLNSGQLESVKRTFDYLNTPELDTPGKLLVHLCETTLRQAENPATCSDCESMLEEINYLKRENQTLKDANTVYAASADDATTKYEQRLQEANNEYAALHTMYETLKAQGMQPAENLQDQPPAPVLTGKKPKKPHNPLRAWESFQ